jgi:hypothetical protein
VKAIILMSFDPNTRMSSQIDAMRSLLRVRHGGGSDFSTIMRAGRSDRKNKRSASWMASARSWVTNSVVTFVRIVTATSSLRSRAATASSIDTKGSSSRRKSGRAANARAIAVRRASPIDNSPGYRARWAAKHLNQLRQIGGGLASRQCKPDVVLDRAPGQKARLLKYNPETSGSRFPEPTTEIPIEAGCDLQDRRLAATGRADQCAERSGFEPRPRTTSTGVPSADNRIDAKLKRGGVASGLRVVQAVAPKGFRSQA